MIPELGWSELLVVAIILIVVVGPKDLPKMLRAFGRTMTKVRTMAGEFRQQFDEAIAEAELDDVKDLVKEAQDLNPKHHIREALDPFAKAGEDIKRGIEDAMKPGTKVSAPVDEPEAKGELDLPDLPDMHEAPAKADAGDKSDAAGQEAPLDKPKNV